MNCLPSWSLSLFQVVRREKEIADTKRELAESENVRHRQLADHLKTQLTEAKEQLVEVTEAAKAQSETAKVRTYI